MKKLIGLLLALFCLTGCAMIEAMDTIPTDLSPVSLRRADELPGQPKPTEATEAIEATEAPDAGISSVEMVLPQTLTVTPENLAEGLTVRFTKVDPQGAPNGRICVLTLLCDGQTVDEPHVFTLREGTELSLALPFTFYRYMPQEEALLTLELSYRDERIRQELPVRLENDPDEVYAARSGEKLPYSIDVLRNENVVVVYGLDEDGAYTQPVHVFLCSTGNATPQGKYRLGDRSEWHALFGNVYGQYAMRLVGNILFHSVPYYRMAKDTLESEEFNKLGTKASMGCIRLAVQDVKWIYDFCPVGTAVHIYDVDELDYEKPEPILIDLDDPRAGWDPTDPDPENPWND